MKSRNRLIHAINNLSSSEAKDPHNQSILYQLQAIEEMIQYPDAEVSESEEQTLLSIRRQQPRIARSTALIFSDNLETNVEKDEHKLGGSIKRLREMETALHARIDAKEGQ